MPLSVTNEASPDTSNRVSLSSPIGSTASPSGSATDTADNAADDRSAEKLSQLNDNDANELEAFDMMIQSAGPFQHPRVAAQAYGHGHHPGGHGAHSAAAAAANSFRHQSYHQVSNLHPYHYI